MKYKTISHPRGLLLTEKEIKAAERLVSTGKWRCHFWGFYQIVLVSVES